MRVPDARLNGSPTGDSTGGMDAARKAGLGDRRYVSLRLAGEADGFAGAGGFAGGIEELHHGDVGVERAEVAGVLDLAVEHGDEVSER